MQAIVTRYLPASATKGPRIAATWGNTRSVISYPDGVTPGEPAHRVAARAVVDKAATECGAPMFSGLMGAFLEEGRYVFIPHN